METTVNLNQRRCIIVHKEPETGEIIYEIPSGMSGPQLKKIIRSDTFKAFKQNFKESDKTIQQFKY
jgi:hypothetical protein